MTGADDAVKFLGATFSEAGNGDRSSRNLPYPHGLAPLTALLGKIASYFGRAPTGAISSDRSRGNHRAEAATIDTIARYFRARRIALVRMKTRESDGRIYRYLYLAADTTVNHFVQGLLLTLK
jgi:hypothetical protein